MIEITHIAENCGNGTLSFAGLTQCFEPTLAMAADGSILITVLGGSAMYRMRGDQVEEIPRVPWPPGADPPDPKTGTRTEGDAILAAGPDGRIYFSVLRPEGIQVASTPDAGDTWDRNALIPNVSGTFQDRQWLAFADDRIYVSWVFLPCVPTVSSVLAQCVAASEGGIAITFSQDGGMTWAETRVAFSGNVIGGRPAVMPNGDVCIPVISGSAPVGVYAACGSEAKGFKSNLVANFHNAGYFPMIAVAAGRPWITWLDNGDQRVAFSLDNGTFWVERESLMVESTQSAWLEEHDGRLVAFGFRSTAGGVESWLASVTLDNMTMEVSHATFPDFSVDYKKAGTDHPHFILAGNTGYAVIADGFIFDGLDSRNVWMMKFSLDP